MSDSNLAPLVIPNAPTFPAEHGFQVHTPDPSKYHNVGGRHILPRSKGSYSNHTSRGFHHEDKPIVLIDPVDPYTGLGAAAVVDFARLDEEQVKRACKSQNTDQDNKDWMLGVMTQLSEEQKAGVKMATAPQLVPVQTTRSAEPTADAVVPTPSALPTGPVISTLPFISPPPAPMPMPGPPIMYPQMLPQQDPLEEVRKLLAALAAQQIQSPPAVPPAPPEVKAPAEPSYTEAQIQDALKLPFVSMAWQPPTVLVTFFTPSGQMRSLYHDVVQRDRCVTLVLDTRRDSQMTFIPAVSNDGDQPIRITVESKKIDVRVHNLDFHSVFGCYDLINLVVAAEDAREE